MERQEIIDEEDNQIDHHENEINQPTNVDTVQEQQSNEPDQVNINDDREKNKFSSFLVSYMYNAY
jgi:hypothetical protein